MSHSYSSSFVSFRGHLFLFPATEPEILLLLFNFVEQVSADYQKDDVAEPDGKHGRDNAFIPEYLSEFHKSVVNENDQQTHSRSETDAFLMFHRRQRQSE